MDPIKIVLSRSRDWEGKTTAKLFDAVIDGRVVVTRSANALRDACWVLLDEMVDPRTPVEARFENDDVSILRTAVGYAAGHRAKAAAS